jgi:hypothetical protein
MDSKGLKLQLAKLSSTNYRSWSTTIKLVLASNDLVTYIELSFNDLIDAKTQELSPSSATPEVVVTAIEATGNNATSRSALITSSAPTAMYPDVQKAIVTVTDVLKLGNAKAMALIAVYVGTKQLLYIANAKPAFEQWWALKQVYEPVGTAQLAALLAAFYGYSQRPGHRVDKVASDLTTLQSDIRVINAGEAPTDTAKLITLTKMLLKSNRRYESTVLVLRQKVGITFEEAILMLKQTEERIIGTDNAARAIETSLFTRGTSNVWGRNSASRKPFPKSKDRPKSNPRNWKPRGNPTRGNKECWHCGSQTHIQTSYPD